MSVERRFQAGFEEEATDDPGLVLGQDGVVQVVAPGGTRSEIASPFLTATAHVTSAEILALADTSKELIATPGPGQGLVPVSVLSLYHFGSIAYVTGNAEVINWGSDHSDQIAPIGIPFLGAAESVSGRWSLDFPGIAAKAPRSIVEDAPLVLNMDVGAPNPTDGDGTLDFLITYYVRAFP